MIHVYLHYFSIEILIIVPILLHHFFPSQAPDSDESSLENLEDIEPSLEDDWFVLDNPDSNFSKHSLLQQCFEEDQTETVPVPANNSSSIPTVGLHWEYGADLEEEPAHMEAPKVATVSEAAKSKFKTPIDSFMMMCPIYLCGKQ